MHRRLKSKENQIDVSERCKTLKTDRCLKATQNTHTNLIATEKTDRRLMATEKTDRRLKAPDGSAELSIIACFEEF